MRVWQIVIIQPTVGFMALDTRVFTAEDRDQLHIRYDWWTVASAHPTSPAVNAFDQPTVAS